MRTRIKKAVILLFAVIALVAVAGISATISFADTYYTISVEYKFSDDSPAYDSYKAVYAQGSNIDIQITNPIIPGYKAVMSLDDNAENALKTTINYTNLNEDKTIVIYYVPAEVKYRVRYYFQNIENDLYTERLDLDASYTDKSGITGTYPAALENIKFEGFTTLFHEPDVIAADGSTVFQIYYDRNYVLMNFELDGGYGVEPIYAKYGTHFNIAEPHKSGYVFNGWRDEKGDVYKFTSGDIPAHDTTYTAVWKAVDTDVTVIFWTENPNDIGYSYNSSIQRQALSGTTVSSHDYYTQWNYSDKDYFIYDDSRIEEKVIEGDGSTILNVYFKRRVYTLKFYYAREKSFYDTTNLTTIEDNQEYLIFNTRANRYLRNVIYNKNTSHLIFDETESVFKFVKANDSNGYYIISKENRYLAIGNGSAYFTDVPTIINVTYNNNGAYWNICSTDECYLNDFGGEKSHAAGWKDSSASTDAGSQWRIYSANIINTKKQIPTFTNNFDASLSINGEESDIILNDTTWSDTNNNDIPILNERYDAKTEIVDNDIYYYFTITGKYEQNLNDEWPLNALEPIEARNRMCFFGAWNPTELNYYRKHPEEFTQNTTIKGQYLKIDKKIMIEGHPEQATIPFLSFWTNALCHTWNWSRQWIYHVYVPILDNEQVDEVQIFEDVKYKKYDVYYTFDTNNNYNEQTPTTLEGFDFLKRTGYTDKEDDALYNSRDDYKNDDYELEHEGGTTSMPSFNANFYYIRKLYTLVFNNNDELKYSVPYESLLSKYNYTPVYPDSTQKDFYKFGGWYTTENCYDGTEFDFSATAKMPAKNIILFPKWEKVKHDVTFYNNYNDYIQKENELKTAQTIHNEMLITTDVPTNLTPITQDAQFTGWYYYDNKNNKIRFDPQSIPVTKELLLFAEWSSKKTAKYNVKYVEQGTDTPVADDTDGTAFIGKTKTFQAKGDNALNASHSWNENGENWWPLVPSHSILIDQNTEDSQPNTYVFEYIKKASVGYTVRYVNAQTGEEVHEPKQVDSKYSIVSEHFEYVKDMIADAVSKTLVLAAYDTPEEEYQNNVITFYYTSNTTDALYQVNHHIQNTDRNGYTLYTTETEIVNLNAEIIPTDSAITIPGFEFISNLTTINGNVETGKGVADGNILIIDLYYNRLTFGYIVYYREYGNENNILETIDKTNDLQILGTVVTHSAPDTITNDNNLYTRIGEAERNLEIRADSGENLTLNIINVYYQKKSFYTINYKAICKPETDKAFGQVSLAYEIVGENEGAQGSTAMLLDELRYEFKGWYRDEQGTQKLTDNTIFDPDSIDFKPTNNEDTTFYAIFGIKTADITITQNGGSENDNFIYRVIDENKNELIVTVKGGGSITIKDLLCGNYTITEITDWDWRYEPDSSGSEKSVTVKDTTTNQVTFTNSPNDKNWLGGESNKDNLFNYNS